MNRTEEHENRIVVGVDGSAVSAAALTWAVRLAALSGATVDAVIAWQYPVGYGVPSPTLQSVDFEDNARQTLSRVVGEVSARAPEVTVRRHVVRSHPAAALIDAADGAQLLVVGHRGRGGFAGALLGSVSQHCVHHAPCPVVVVRGEPGTGPDS
ncbi:universal stress protein [Kitasatospora purpeofusca]|uniref:universal stress protein n=1 Tax=Kitasatospora purpeofusca TaxID=67352 RepID=UPI0033E4DAF0